MRGPSHKEVLGTNPPELREKGKNNDAYLDIRRKILTGEYKANDSLSTKDIREKYDISNSSIPILLIRLAGEGLVNILPIRERKGTNNAAINDYRVADLDMKRSILSTRQRGFVSDNTQEDQRPHIESLVLKIVYADEEIASLLGIIPGENVIYHRTLQRRDPHTVVAIADTYLPFWFAEAMPQLEKPDSDIYQIMRNLGKNPVWCTETVDVTHATSAERVHFELSPDDPAALLKILRRAYDDAGNCLSVDFLTDRGDTYRLHYSFPLFADGIPEPLRNK